MDATEYSEDEPRALINGRLPAKELLDMVDLNGERNWAKDLRRARLLPEIYKRPGVDLASAPPTQNVNKEGTTGEYQNCSHHSVPQHSLGPSKKTEQKNKKKYEKRKAGYKLGAAAIAKKRRVNEMRSLQRGVKIETEVDVVNRLKRTGPAFKGMNMSTKEAREMRRLESYTYVPSIPG